MLKISHLKNSWLLSAVLASGIAVFLLTADVTDIDHAENPSDNPPQQAETEQLPSPVVEVRQFEPETINRTLVVYGRTDADRSVTVRAELPARITNIHARRGEMLEKGQSIAQLREGSIPAKLDYAKAKLKQAEQEYQSALSLKKKNHIAQNRLTELEVAVAEAESTLRELQVQLANTRIKSPIDGIINVRHSELGDFLDKGDPVAEILDLDPLIIKVDVPQNMVPLFASGDTARVKLNGRPWLEANIRFINRQADEATRTFSVELALPNPNMMIPAGLSVEAELFIDEVSAIAVSPANLSLNDKGELGIKWVTPENQVQFTLARIAKSESNYLWLTDIPEDAWIITRGHGFVNPGDSVQVKHSDEQFLAGESTLR